MFIKQYQRGFFPLCKGITKTKRGKFWMGLIFSLMPILSFASQYDAELLSLTNAERAKQGLSALTLSNQLGQAAQNHAEDMANNNYYDHIGLNGSTPGDRIEATGYVFQTWAENIAAGFTSPAEAVEGWMNSPGHRANILNGALTQIGFGYSSSSSSDYGSYWVQVFATPSGGSSQSYTLSVQSSGNGTVSGSGSYQAGATVTLTATPSSGYTFSGWSPSPCANTFTMPANNLTCTATFTSSGGGTTSGRIGGISTNALVNTTAADYMIAGVYITGGTKRLVVRGVSVDNGIINPRLTVQTFPDGTIIYSNDDWQNHASASEVQQAGYAPTNSKDAAMVINLAPGLYTFTVSPEGVKGKAIVEVYELETGTTNKIEGISTNAVVGTNVADYMIAGVFISGGSKKVKVRASSVDGVLDPKLTVQSFPDGKVLYTNSSWQSDPSAAQVQQLGYAPARTTDAAMVITLPQGLFTFTVSPEGTAGKGIIEVYEVGENSSERILKTTETYVDTQTGLEWMAGDIINLERDEAIAHCEALDYGGYQNWRLSTNSELSNFIKALSQSSVKPDYFGSFSGCKAGITTDGYTALLIFGGSVPFGEPINFMGYAAVRCVR